MEKSKESTSETALSHPLLSSSSQFKTPPTGKYAFAAALIASMAALLLDIILAGSIHLYSLAGSLTAGWTSDPIGRRNTLLLTSTIYFVGPLVTCVAYNYSLLMVGRFITGVAVGYMVVARVYVAEVSPAATRGFLTALPEVAVNAGLLLAYVSNFAFACLPPHFSWRLMFALGSVPALFLGFGTLSMPESPRWLVMKGQLTKAREVLVQISDSQEEAEALLTEIKEKAGITTENTQEIIRKDHHNRNIWRELIRKPTPAVRRIIITVLALQFLEQASGIDTVVLYSPRIFEKAGMSSKKDLLGTTIFVGVTKTALISVPMLLSDRVGRRPLLLVSTAGMAASLLLLGLGLQMIGDFSTTPTTWIVVVCIVAVLSYVTMAYSSETIPLKLRAQGMGLAIAVNRIVCGIVAMTFISLCEAVSVAWTFSLYAMIAGFTFVFVCRRREEGIWRKLRRYLVKKKMEVIKDEWMMMRK